jgi:hypothetical protein
MTRAVPKKPTVYLDTTVLSSYWYEGADVLAIGRRITTREWWDAERSHFVLFASSVTEDELEAGVYRGQAEALAMSRRLKFLPMLTESREFAELLIQRRVVAASKPGDALQMAIAAAHHVDYLLTWNYAHLANPVAQAQLETVCRKVGWRAPLLVSPETIPRVALGQTIRRK